MSEPIVTVKNGKLRGKIEKNYDGGEYYSFQGIPYAKPPIGPLRFRPPSPAESWEGVKEATREGSECLMFNMMIQAISGSEDCLFLNVYTPNLPDKSKKLKPVMVWIHGGGFTMGSGGTELHGPDYLMTRDVVIVTINYRLGLLGFLNFEDRSLDVPGNAGLKDQVLALKWVQQNIEQFSGDPNNVTIFGVSAGGASVHYLMLSPLAKGLFHKCIVQSGCALASWTKGQRTLPYITDALEITTTDEKKVFKMLSKMSPEELMELQQKMKESFEPSHKRCFAPVVEPVSDGSFLSDEPEQIILSGNYHQIPMMIGFTSREGIFANVFSDDAKHGFVIQDIETKLPHTVNIVRESESPKILANKIKNYYYGEEQPCEKNKTQFYLMHGDALFQWPAIMSIKYHSNTSTSPIYLYRFSADARLNYVKNLFMIQAAGACHGDEIPYLFKPSMVPFTIPNSTEEKIMRGMVELFTNFATYGNPNSPKANPLIKVIWKPVNKECLHYIDIGENFTVGVNPEEERMKFWEDLTSFSIDNTTL